MGARSSPSINSESRGSFTPMRRRPVAALVLAALTVLPPVAYTDPPDPVDIHGVWDPTDDASRALTGHTAVLCAALVASPVSLLLGGVAASEARAARVLAAAPSDPRAPPPL